MPHGPQTALKENHEWQEKSDYRGGDGKFSGKGEDKKAGVSWKIKAKFVSRKKAKGSFEASKFNAVFNPFVPFDSELCAGSGKWTAKLKR